MGPQSRAIGPYTLEKRLGAGGMGEVFQAYDRRLDRWVAIKLIRPEAAGSATARERFRREARAAARLSHPSIVQIHDIVESDESDAIVMELVEGEPLARRLARGPLPVDETMRIGREIAEGLAAAHAKGLIHRDLKPENVMVTPEGHAKILDFGLAKRLEGEAEQGLTQDFTVVGTVHTMSPEQARGLPLDARSDLFSLGALLYEMLAGGSPFAAATPLDTLSNVCTLRQRPLRELDPAVPEPPAPPGAAPPPRRSAPGERFRPPAAERPRGRGEPRPRHRLGPVPPAVRERGDPVRSPQERRPAMAGRHGFLRRWRGRPAGTERPAPLAALPCPGPQGVVADAAPPPGPGAARGGSVGPVLAAGAPARTALRGGDAAGGRGRRRSGARRPGGRRAAGGAAAGAARLRRRLSPGSGAG